MKGTCKEHALNNHAVKGDIQGHHGNIEGTFREHVGHVKGT
jgi:hypothetical protein